MNESATFVVRADRLEHLVGRGTLASRAAVFLEAAVVAGLNVLVFGGTQAGNTTSAKDTPTWHVLLHELATRVTA